MPNSTTSPNMGLTIPTVSVDPQVQWGNDLNSSLTVIDTHDHSSGKGVKITPNGITINIDLSFVSNNATNLRSARFTQQSTSLTGPNDLGCAYDVLGDLWWNNASGTPVQITKGSVLNAAALLSNTWNTVSFSGTRTMHATDGYTLLIFDATSVVCTANLPAASTVPKGTYYIFLDGYGTVENNSLTLSPNGSDLINGFNGSYVFQQNYGHLLVESDGVNHWYVQPSGGYYNRGNSIVLSNSGSFIRFGTAGATISTGAVNNTTILVPNLSVALPSQTPASFGLINTPNNVPMIAYRNAANTNDIICLTNDSSNNLTLGNGNIPTLTFQAGSVVVQTGIAFDVWTGTTDLQTQTITQYPYVYKTTTNGANTVFTLTVPSNVAISVKHEWVAKNTSTGSCWCGSSIGLYEQAGGGITIIGSQAIFTTLGSSPPTVGFATGGANTVEVTVTGIVVTNIDWQGLLTVSIN